jgi:predicted RNA methylase
MRISDGVLAVLSAAEVDGPKVRLPKVERDLYLRCDKVLRAAGGAWTRSVQAHVFPTDARDALDQVLVTGQITTPQEMGWFPTPAPVVEQLLDLAQVGPGMMALEPSAGEGAIAGPMRARGATVVAIEIDEGRARTLRAHCDEVHVADFLTVLPQRVYDRVVMNPPFGRQADLAHVGQALNFLREGGRLVAVMAAGIRFRTNGATPAMRRVIETHGEIIDLPDGSFRASGTDVRAVIVRVDLR